MVQNLVEYINPKLDFPSFFFGSCIYTLAKIITGFDQKIVQYDAFKDKHGSNQCFLVHCHQKWICSTILPITLWVDNLIFEDIRSYIYKPEIRRIQSKYRSRGRQRNRVRLVAILQALKIACLKRRAYHCSGNARRIIVCFSCAFYDSRLRVGLLTDLW